MSRLLRRVTVSINMSKLDQAFQRSLQVFFIGATHRAIIMTVRKKRPMAISVILFLSLSLIGP